MMGKALSHESASMPSIARKKKSHAWMDVLRQRYRVVRAILSARFASLYYLVASHAFDREMRAVAQGRILYFQEIATSGGNQALLRRNVHRLEKGLIMRPFRMPFAKDYILETAQAFAYLAARQSYDEADDVRWAADVLRSYFAAMSASEESAITRAHEIFEKALKEAHFELQIPAGYVPYPRGEAPMPIEFEPFAALCLRRRSVRWYRQQAVPRELVDKALEAALQSPSACNRQSFSFRFFDDPEMVRAVANIPGGTKGYADSLPGVAVVIGKLRAYPEERDRHIIYIDGSLASMSFMLALETLGLSSCAINWPDMAENEDAIRKLLDLAPDERVIMLIGFGYADPDGMIPYSAKKPVGVIRRWN